MLCGMAILVKTSSRTVTKPMAKWANTNDAMKQRMIYVEAKSDF